MKPSVVLAVLLCLASGPVAAADATCRDYLKASGDDRALFNGFVFGYTSAKLEQRSDDEVNAATATVLRMVGLYCEKKPDDRVRNVIAGFATIVARLKNIEI